MRPVESIANVLFPSASIATSPTHKPSRIESEVIELFKEFRNPLLRYTISLGLPVHDAEEVVQEVFLALFRHLQLGRADRNLRGWLFRVAHNLALKQRFANQTFCERVAHDASIEETHVDPLPGPEERVCDMQRQHRLLAVLEALPQNDQACVRLRAEGLRYREIADVLGISLGAVSISLTRSLARLVRADGR